MSFDFAISELTSDFSIKNGCIVISYDANEVVQRVKMRLKWLLGEWFLDTTKGLPWFQQIAGGKNTNNAVMLIRDQITSTSGVDSINKINVIYDAQKRSLSIYAVIVVNGQNVIISKGV